MIPRTDAAGGPPEPGYGTLAGRVREFRTLLLRPEFLRPTAALWAVLLVLWVAAYARAENGAFAPGRILGQAGFEAASWMGMAVVGVTVGWLLPTGRRARPVQVAALVAVSLLLVALRVEAIRMVVPYLRRDATITPPPFLTAFIFYLPRSLFVATTYVGFGFGMRLILQEQAERAETLRMQAGVTAARLEALRHRLRPRLFLSCVDVISRRMRQEPAAADRLVLQLGDLLRSQLARGRTEQVRLDDELAFVALYLGVEAECAPWPLAVEVRADDGARATAVPANCVAVLAEAAVRAHAAAGGPGRLALLARGDGEGGVRVVAEDDVPGSVEHRRAAGLLEQVQELSDTLAARLGPACGVRVEDRPGGGVVATLHLPGAP